MQPPTTRGTHKKYVIGAMLLIATTADAMTLGKASVGELAQEAHLRTEMP